MNQHSAKQELELNSISNGSCDPHESSRRVEDKADIIMIINNIIRF